MADSKKSIFRMWIIYLFGTFFHELAHFSVGLMTFAFPYKISIIPIQSEDKQGYLMGHVKFINLKYYNVFVVSLAPLILIPISYFIYGNFFTYFSDTIINFFIYIYIIVSLLFSSIPSNIDFKNIVKGNIVANVLFGIITLTLLFFLKNRFVN